MISFGIMQVEGFASVVNEEFDWGQEGLNIIQAPNGSGKTTFINALVWGIFGKVLSGSVEPWEHTRPDNYRGTKIVIPIIVGKKQITITRHNNYTKLKNAILIHVDGDLKDWGNKNETQKKINDTLGYTFDLFKNSIIFGQKLKRLISETGPNKKKVFDDAFEITYIQRAKDISSNTLSTLRTDVLKQEKVFDKVSEKLTGKKVEITAEENMVANFETIKKSEIKTERKVISGLKAKIKQIEFDWTELDNLNHDLEISEKDSYSQIEIIKEEQKLGGLKVSLLNLEETAKQLIKSKLSLETKLENVPTKCDHCQRAYTKSNQSDEKKRIKKEIENNVSEYQKEIDSISKLKRQIKELKTTISSANNTNKDIEYCKEHINKLEEVKSTISEYGEKIEEHRKKVKEIKKKELENNLEELYLELTALENQFKVEKKKLRRLNKDVEIQEWLIKDPLSNSGLKAFIFNQMLDNINERLEFYTKFIDFQVAFFMDMKSANKNLETYVFKGEEPVPYDDLSGGQQQAVDIVTAFAIHDIVSDTKNCSLLVMDEVFESLDKDNIEIMTELIQEKAQEKCLYLVTHRAEFNPTNSNIIKVRYSDGVSSLY